MSGKSLRDTLGMLGVIASLIFVGLELRQTNQMARQETLRDMADRASANNMLVVLDERMSGLAYRVQEGARASDFSGADLHSLRLYFHTANHVWQSYYRQIQLGLLDPIDRPYPAPDNLWWSSAFHRDIWPSIRPAFTEDYAVFWEERFGLSR